MTVPAYNKVTRVWVSTEDGSELTPPENWIINPLFADEAFAREIGPNYWTFSGNTINTPTRAEYDALKKPEHQLEAWKQIQAERDRRQAAGVLVGTTWFHTDQTSRIQYLGLMMYGTNMPSTIMWKTMSGEFVQMTPTLAQQIFATIAAKDTAIFTVAEQRRVLMEAAPSPLDYDYLTGDPAWPVVFGE